MARGFPPHRDSDLRFFPSVALPTLRVSSISASRKQKVKENMDEVQVLLKNLGPRTAHIRSLKIPLAKRQPHDNV